MSKKHRRSGNRTSGGRPRKTGDRTTSGRLQDVGPNEVVLANRRTLLGDGADLTKAENAMDVALARGWLTEGQHRAAGRYAQLYRRSGFDLPTLRTSSLDEGEGWYSQEVRRSGVFVDGVIIRPNRDREGDPIAMLLLHTLWTQLKPHEKRALNDLCLVPGLWPRWVILRLRGLAIVDRDYVLLISALTVVEKVLDDHRKAAQMQKCQGRNAA